MKLKSLIVLIIAFGLTSCGGIELRFFTRLNPDGSVFKRVIAVGDSAAIYDKPFSFDVDDGWNLQYKKEINVEKGDTLFMAIVEKTFADYKEAHQAMHHQSDQLVDESISIESNSKYRWFYTYYNYKEIFEQRFPFQQVSISDYLSQEEYYYFILDDSTVVASMDSSQYKVFDQVGEQKFWSFIIKAVYLEYEILLEEYATKKGYQFLSDKDLVVLENYMSSILNDGSDIDSLCSKVDELTGSTWAIEAFHEGVFDNFKNQLDKTAILDSGNNYLVEIEVPGSIYETNALELENNKATWVFKANMFHYKDFSLEINYRTANWYAFIVTFGLVIYSLWLIFYNKK